MHKLFIILIFIWIPSAYSKEHTPITQINKWIQKENHHSKGQFINYGTLTTQSLDGDLQASIIEITRITKQSGIIFFLHQESPLINNMPFNSTSSIVIHLPHIQKQICIKGVIQPLDTYTTEKHWNQMAYFLKIRFLASKRGLYSEPLLEMEYQREYIRKQLPKTLPCPNTFQGFSLIPNQLFMGSISRKELPVNQYFIFNNDKWTSLNHP